MILVKNLCKYYGNTKAVDDLSFEIEDGHIYGFLGPNGAGKSTTMNMMTGCLSMNDGTIEIAGHDIFEEPIEAKKLIGYLPEIPPLYVDSTPIEYLTFVAEAKGIKKENIQKEIDEVIKETKIEDVKGRLIKHLSKGYRQRVGIAQALLGNPEVIVLDEPTVGLDPAQIIEIRDLIKELGTKHTVILSSHILSEVQAICDRIIIINKGKIVANDTPENLEKHFVKNNVIEVISSASKQKCNNALKDIKSIASYDIKEEDNKTFVSVIPQTNDEEVRKDIFNTFTNKKIDILELKTNKANLEDIFMELIKTDEILKEVDENVSSI